KISSEAIAALTICFPIQMIFGGLGIATGVGAGSFVSRMFGVGDDSKANRAAGQIIFLSLFFGVAIILSGVFFYEPILRFFGATETILPLSAHYLTVVVFGSPFLLFMMMTDYLFRAEGNPNVPMYVISFSAAMNTVLDPFLIFGWGPFPEMGIKGAALATVISQFAVIFLSIYFLLFSHSKYRLKPSHVIPHFSTIYSIYKVGVPTFIIHIAMSLVLTIYNQVLGNYGSLAIATLGLGFRINGILMMVLFGIGHGVMPMVGFNYGAGNYKRLKKIIRIAARFSAFIGGVSCLLIEVFTYPLLSIFTEDPELLAIAIPAFRIYVITQFLVGPNIVWINLFNGIGKGMTSMTLLLTRQLIFLIPLIYVLPPFFGINGVWMAQPIANVLVFFIILSWTQREFRMLERKKVVMEGPSNN
ncbi:MAG: MATE family efflux transporter, partial [Thermodesulfobacteriota bacterium]|nr:MATE family efflux transporter [Thermodesulfobacteriota bacterium]